MRNACMNEKERTKGGRGRERKTGKERTRPSRVRHRESTSGRLSLLPLAARYCFSFARVLAARESLVRNRFMSRLIVDFSRCTNGPADNLDRNRKFVFRRKYATAGHSAELYLHANECSRCTRICMRVSARRLSVEDKNYDRAVAPDKFTTARSLPRVFIRKLMIFCFLSRRDYSEIIHLRGQ